MIYPNIHVTQSRVGPVRDIGGIYDMVGFSCWVSCVSLCRQSRRISAIIDTPTRFVSSPNFLLVNHQRLFTLSMNYFSNIFPPLFFLLPWP